MDDSEVSKIHDQIEGKLDAIRTGRSLSQLAFATGIGKCFSCERAWIMRTKRHNDPIVRCNAEYNDPVIVPHDITDSTRYARKGEVDIWTLIKMHNPVDLSKPDAVMGFKTNEQSPETSSV